MSSHFACENHRLAHVLEAHAAVLVLALIGLAALAQRRCLLGYRPTCSLHVFNYFFFQYF